MALNFLKFIAKKTKKKRPVLFVHVDGEVHTKVKALAKKYKITMSATVRALVLAALEEDSK